MKNKKVLMIILIIILIAIFCVCSYLLLKDVQELNECRELTENLIKESIKTNVKTQKKYIDWNYLENINKDMIGWIKIEDTNINYPILKDNSNLKYLRHSYNGKYNNNGSIFTLDEKPFIKKNTTIYGHNMKNKIMFSELSNYMNKDFFFLHQNFKIYTPKNNYKAKIFSVYYLDEDEEKRNIKDLEFKDEIKYYKDKSIYKIKQSTNIEKIVKLSTCSYINSRRMTNQRFYIIANIEKIK